VIDQLIAGLVIEPKVQKGYKLSFKILM